MVSKWGPDGPPDDSYTLDVSADGTVRVVISDALYTGSSMTVRLSSAGHRVSRTRANHRYSELFGNIGGWNHVGTSTSMLLVKIACIA